MPWININDKEVWREERNTFQLADIIWITTDRHNQAKGIVEAIIPSGTLPSPEFVEKYWKLNPSDKLYSTITYGEPSKYDRYIVSLCGSNGDYFIFPVNPKAFEQNVLYGRGFVVEKLENTAIESYTMLSIDWPKLENGKEDTWWNRLILLRDSYYCVEKHAADCMVIDEGSYKTLLKELDNHPTEALWFQNCCTIIVVPRIGRSEVHFYKALSIN